MDEDQVFMSVVSFVDSLGSHHDRRLSSSVGYGVGNVRIGIHHRPDPG
jgi:hypothetical protein